MKKWIALAAVVFSFLGAAEVKAFDPRPNEVILFQKKNFGGASIRLSVGAGIPNLTKQEMGKSNWNDSVSSIKVGANVRLITFEHKDYQGICMGFLGSNSGGHAGGKYPRLEDWKFGDRITSLKVFEGDDPEARCP